MREARRPVVLIAGPTAGGKSAVALELARLRPSRIINADALQVYRELPIVTAQPGRDDHKVVPHRLYGHVPAATVYSVGHWLEEVGRELEECRAGDAMPIIVGGTGLYFRALERGLARVPAIPPEVRALWRGRLREAGAGELHDELARRSRSEAQRLRPSDGQRIVRALEVLDATGRPLSYWQKETGEESALAGFDALRIHVAPPRDELYRRCDARFERMLTGGAVEEVRALMALRLDRALPAMRAIGVAELAWMIEGKRSPEDIVAIAQRNTRNYVKRQLTWARRNMISWSWLDQKYSERLNEEFFNFIRLQS
jgi:tRNA dimethylallyltransferase